MSSQRSHQYLLFSGCAFAALECLRQVIRKHRAETARYESVDLARKMVEVVGAGDGFLLRPEQREEAVALIARSFCGTSKTAPEGVTNALIGPTLGDVDHPMRHKWYDYLAHLFWAKCALPGGGVAIGVRKRSGECQM